MKRQSAWRVAAVAGAGLFWLGFGVRPAFALRAGPVLTGDYAFPGLFARNETSFWQAGEPTREGLRLQSRDGTTLVILEGVDPPLPFDNRKGYGCVSLVLKVDANGRIRSYRLADAIPADGNFDLMKQAFSMWRFNTSDIKERSVRLPITAIESTHAADYVPPESCRFPVAAYGLTLQSNVSLDRDALVAAPDFIVHSRQEPLRDVTGAEYPKDLLHQGQQGCVSVSFTVDARGRPGDFNLLKAWPDNPVIARAFAEAAAGGLEAMPALRVQGAPDARRSLALVRFTSGDAQAEPPAGACAPDLRPGTPAE